MNTYITIPNFFNLTEREAIEMSVKHVLGNARPSVPAGGGNGCLYSGIGCGAAVFINPDDRGDADRAAVDAMVDGQMVGTSWDELVSLGYVPDHLSKLITNLQSCHDDAAEVWREVLNDNASESEASEAFVESYKELLADNDILTLDDPLLA